MILWEPSRWGIPTSETTPYFIIAFEQAEARVFFPIEEVRRDHLSSKKALAIGLTRHSLQPQARRAYSYLKAIAALEGPARWISSKRLKPTSRHHFWKSAPE